LALALHRGLERLEISLPAVSRHLKVLESAGLIDRTVSGRVHHCSLKEATLADAESWIRWFWDSSLTKSARYVE
jgi:DNA-binding transcriptional ArsR family regulator